MFSTLTEAQLRNRLEPDKGMFIAESPKVIHVALDAGYQPLAILCEERHITGDAASILENRRTAYLQGDSSLLDYLMSVRVYNDTAEQCIAAKAGLTTAAAELLRALGL